MALLGFWDCEDDTLETGWTKIANAAMATGRGGSTTVWSITSSASRKYLWTPASAVCILGAAAKVETAFGATAFLTLYGDAGATAHLAFNFDGTGHIVAKRGATTLATSTWAGAVGTFYYIEIKATISDTVGTIDIRVDGASVMSLTAQDTKNGGTNSTIDAFQISGGSTSPGHITFDDIYLLDGTGSAPYNAFLGDVKVERLLPNGNGASSQLVGSDGNSTDNYALVDDPTINTSDYVGSATAGQKDLYDVATLTGIGAVDAVQAQLYAANSDAGAGSIKPLIRASTGTITTDPAQTLSASYQLLVGPVHLLDPDGAAWTTASVNAAQVGAEVL